MARHQSVGWMAFLFGALALALIAGSLIHTVQPDRVTPTAWNAPDLATATPDQATETPGWWGDEATPPTWPTAAPTAAAADKATPAATDASSNFPTVPAPGWFDTATPAIK